MPILKQAIQILQNGGLVAFPTETVYGLGADASNETAVKRIYLAKERPFHNPLIVHLAHIDQLNDWAKNIPSAAYQLAQVFWPGPLTLILEKQDHVLDMITAGQNTVAVRIPAHSLAQMLLREFGKGIAAPSANKFTHISPTTAAAVKAELGEAVDLILDGGPCEVGLESTIVDLSQKEFRILRPGKITAAEISKVIRKNIIDYPMPLDKIKNLQDPLQHQNLILNNNTSTDINNNLDGNDDLNIPLLTTLVPGMHAVHYAPHTPTRLINKTEILALCRESELIKHQSKYYPCALITHSMVSIENFIPAHTHRNDSNLTPLVQRDLANKNNLSMLNSTKSPITHYPLPHQPQLYAQALYQTLRLVDQQNFKQILIEAVPNHPDWLAVADRLSKASE